jgi:hypothetical protein
LRRIRNKVARVLQTKRIFDWYAQLTEENMSILRSLSGLLSSAIETPPSILAATRSFSLTSAESRDLLSSAGRQPDVVDEFRLPAAQAMPEVDLSHLSAEERQQIAAVMARAQGSIPELLIENDNER